MRSLSLILPVVAVLQLGACNGEEGEPGPAPDARGTLMQAAKRTVEVGPAWIEATVRSGRVHYKLDGRLDPEAGYRVCAVIAAAPVAYLRDKLLWLDGRAGTYGTLTTLRGQRCAAGGPWLDDHPPTLPLQLDQDARPYLARGRGAEDVLHAALVALTGLKGRTLTAARASACGRSQCYGAQVDFEVLDRKPNQWIPRPALAHRSRPEPTEGGPGRLRALSLRRGTSRPARIRARPRIAAA